MSEKSPISPNEEATVEAVASVDAISTLGSTAIGVERDDINIEEQKKAIENRVMQAFIMLNSAVVSRDINQLSEILPKLKLVCADIAQARCFSIEDKSINVSNLEDFDREINKEIQSGSANWVKISMHLTNVIDIFQKSLSK